MKIVALILRSVLAFKKIYSHSIVERDRITLCKRNINQSFNVILNFNGIYYVSYRGLVRIGFANVYFIIFT